jgi:hypothetical protein
MGSSTSGGRWQDASYRGDVTCWVTGAKLQAAGQALPAACLEMLTALRSQLAAQGWVSLPRILMSCSSVLGRSACAGTLLTQDAEQLLLCAACRYDVGGRISCQLACYPGKGARYVRHTDASASAPDRSVTALLYLNPDWDAQVGSGTVSACGSGSNCTLHICNSLSSCGVCVAATIRLRWNVCLVGVLKPTHARF